MTRREMDYRVGVCGWPRGCFSDDGTQLYTPAELEALAQADEHSCPSGVCVPMGHGHNLTGVSIEDYSKAREAVEAGRLAVLCNGPRAQPAAPTVKQLPTGGEWIRVGGAEVQPAAQPANLSLWALLTGAR